MSGYALFDTAIGRSGISWNDRGISGVQLPEESEALTRTRLLRRQPGAVEADPPAEIREAIAAMGELLAGARRDLSRFVVDLEGVPAFHQRVYAATRAIPPGRTSTYGEMARRLDAPGSARAVGQALGRNPFPLVVPCHRVLAAGGAMGGFSARGGAVLKRRLLAIEGVRLSDALSLFGD